MNTENEKIIGVIKDIEYIRKDISDIRQIFKDQAVLYATQQQLNELAKDIAELKKSNFHKYGIPFISSIVTAVFVFLIIFFFNNVK